MNFLRDIPTCQSGCYFWKKSKWPIHAQKWTKAGAVCIHFSMYRIPATLHLPPSSSDSLNAATACVGGPPLRFYLVWRWPQFDEDASAGLLEDVRGLEASVLLHCLDRHGHLPLVRGNADHLGDLQVHHGKLPVLQEQHTPLAEFPPT